MNTFAALLDRLVYESRRNAKIRLIADYLRATPDPERGFALAALTGELSFREAKPNLIRALIQERCDPVLFEMSYSYVGDLAETTALLWPAPISSRPEPPRVSPLPRGEGPGVWGVQDEASSSMQAGRAGASGEPFTRRPSPPTPPHEGEGSASSVSQAAASLVERNEGIGHNRPPPSLSEVVEALATTSKSDLPARLAAWLDALDETGRWALLKLITGSLRIGVSARLAKTALASLGEMEPDAVEEVWHGLQPPYVELFAWVEGRGERPVSRDPAPFRPPMLAHPLELEDFGKLDAGDFTAEWKWDGIRVQAVSFAGTTRLYSRTGEDVSAAFPDLVVALDGMEAAIDGELLVLVEGRVQSFNVLQQRLNRKSVSNALMTKYPAHLRAYDLLGEGEEDLRSLPFAERRTRLEAFVARGARERLDLSPLVPFADWDALTAARTDPASHGAGDDADAVEGVMVKRADSSYVPGRPKGLWFKWKREPYTVDAVMMYAQRGHGKRSSFYSDYTFGVWRPGAEGGEELVPVGKAYFGFTDEELAQLDRFVRNNTTNRFGPVREVVHTAEKGLVLEIAFEGLQRSTRHKSGVAMRFPRVARIRWDKPTAEADRLETLTAILAKGETEQHPTG
ncbi:cisplatin damage response ATP-dependent DNA ligase [Salinarimonas ramus]|uniref:DNA ligase (ATP) n=1 Tax=Salinarimonas ramus TaxID=690164 RepID=A0A917Q6B2_9HYPH|nr:cisplatin damage response ATP-dependent DNA ligase [Salinarimonas ramus]GGK29437.1 ATP-dependent DNA ligase [Salinarimonas ramus]